MPMPRRPLRRVQYRYCSPRYPSAMAARPVWAAHLQSQPAWALRSDQRRPVGVRLLNCSVSGRQGGCPGSPPHALSSHPGWGDPGARATPGITIGWNYGASLLLMLVLSSPAEAFTLLSPNDRSLERCPKFVVTLPLPKTPILLRSPRLVVVLLL